jgi:SOS response regulatory protein OraA/RecX
MPVDAFGSVVDALARRDLTEQELDARLDRAGYDEDARADALARARDAGYLDDERVAHERAGHLAERGASDAAIRADLARRGLPDELVSAALAAVPPEMDRATAVAAKLGGGPRAARALARKGYAEDTIERVVGGELQRGGEQG